MTESVTGPGRDSVGTDSDDGALVAVVEAHPDGPDECTLFPGSASEEELLTTWMTASEGSYVSLAEMR